MAYMWASRKQAKKNEEISGKCTNGRRAPFFMLRYVLKGAAKAISLRTLLIHITAVKYFNIYKI